MESFPKEMLSEIMKNLSGKDIINVCKTNKILSLICTDDPKFKNLWRQKIEEDFAEIYTGDNPYKQYNYLNRLHSQKFYLVYYTDRQFYEKEIVGIYDTYGKALMCAIEKVSEVFGSMVPYTFESIREMFWNKNYIQLHRKRIEIIRRELDNKTKNDI